MRSCLLEFDATVRAHADGLSVTLVVHCHTKMKRGMIFTQMKDFLHFFFLTVAGKAVKWDESLRTMMDDGALQMSPWSLDSTSRLC